jgi:hypothetical protein
VATVSRGSQTTQSRKPVSQAKVTGVTLTDKVEAEKNVEHPVVYISTEGKNGAWLRSPDPIYGDGGRVVKYDNGLRIEFTEGISNPYYASNPIHKKTIAEIDRIIDENWPIVHDLGLKRLEQGAPVPPLRKWDKLSLDAIKVALTANFSDNYDDNVRILEAGVRYELSKDKPRRDVVKVLEAMVGVEAAEASAQIDALDVEVEA